MPELSLAAQIRSKRIHWSGSTGLLACYYILITLLVFTFDSDVCKNYFGWGRVIIFHNLEVQASHLVDHK